MRLILVLLLLLTAALILASFVTAEPPAANELGRIMILEYHKIDYPEERWTRTPENFRHDLETLYAGGYRLQSLSALVGSIGLIASMPITTALAAILAPRMSDRQLAAAEAHPHAH